MRIAQFIKVQLQLGHATAAVPGKDNEDFHGIVTPHEDREAQSRGVAVAIADGVSGNGGGRLASETVVKSLLRDFYGAPVSWNIARALDHLLRSINDWLLSENARHPEYDGMVTTLTMIVFKGNYYHMAHVGDTRVYRRHGDVFNQLTVDHNGTQRCDGGCDRGRRVSGLLPAAGSVRLDWENWPLRCRPALSTLSAFDYRRRAK